VASRQSFAHKKYDTVSLEYVDADGGIHGAIFQLKKGQSEIVKNELMTHGVTISCARQSAKTRRCGGRMKTNKYGPFVGRVAALIAMAFAFPAGAWSNCLCEIVGGSGTSATQWSVKSIR